MLRALHAQRRLCGPVLALALAACTPWSDVDLDGDGWSTEAGDCDDGDDAVHPSVADGVGDGIDRNCDGHDGVDVDGDGIASRASGGEDCDDRSAEVNPGAIELCNDIDDDCDDRVDIGAEDATPYYEDRDADSYGAGEVRLQCSPPGAGWIDRGLDCDDQHATVHPGAFETCGYDFNCDGVVTDCLSLMGELEPSDGLVFEAVTQGSQAGWSVSVIGDVDGDGIVDIAVGAPEADVTWIVRGPVSQGFSLDNAIPVIGPVGARSGVAVSPIGDVDGDGFADLAIGAELDDAGGQDAGAVWLLHGPIDDAVSLSTGAPQLIGASIGAQAGHAVVGVTDGDGDGRPDVLVGAWSQGAGGAAYLMPADTSFNVNLSAATVVFEGEADEGAGWSLASGDLDGDGLSDAVIGAPFSDAGTAYVSLGRVAVAGQIVSLSTSDASLQGVASGDAAGWSLAVGDVDGDGLDDLWVSAPRSRSGAGDAWLFLGAADAWNGLRSVDQAEGHLAGVGGEGLGQSLAVVPDVDGDGQGELLVAGVQPLGRSDNGVVWLFAGPQASSFETSAATAVFSGTQDGDRLGTNLSAGDVNGDGRGDLLLGAPGAGADGWGPGSAILFWGG